MEISREDIFRNLKNPQALETLYQSNKKAFTEIIKTMYFQEDDLIIKYWYTRLFYKSENKTDNATLYLFTAFLVILSWIPIRLRFLNSLWNNIYLTNLIPILISISFSLYFIFPKLKIKNIFLLILPNLIMYFYIILLPTNGLSQSLNNASIFMLVLLWYFVLFTYSGFNIKKLRFPEFLEQFGEVIIWSTVFIIGGIVIVGLSLALFSAIQINAFEFYYRNIITMGLVASPFVSLLIIKNSNRAKLSAIIANVFLPIILLSLIVFGMFSIFADIKPYENRNIFITYNVMMVIVIGVLTFTSINGINNVIINACFNILPIVAVILNGITMSATIFRLAEFGITPNKITLLGTNILMLGHLVYIIILKIKKNVDKNVMYLSTYFFWALIVVFIFPFVFRMT